MLNDYHPRSLNLILVPWINYISFVKVIDLNVRSKEETKEYNSRNERNLRQFSGIYPSLAAIILSPIERWVKDRLNA